MNKKNQRGGAAVGILVGLVAAVLLTLGITSCTTVDTGHVGVPTVFGKVQGYTLEPGMHFINPFASVEHMNVRTRNYTMSSVHGEGQQQGDDSVGVVSKDQLKVGLDVTILYRLKAEKAPDVLAKVGTQVDEQIVRPQVRAALRDNAANYLAVEMLTSKKDAFSAAITEQLAKALSNYGIELEQVLIRNVVLPQQITDAINNKLAAEQESEKMKFVLAKEQQEAERKRVQAKGEADYNAINAEKLTPTILEARRIAAFEKLAEAGNVVVVPQGQTMLLNLPQKK